MRFPGNGGGAAVAQIALALALTGCGRSVDRPVDRPSVDGPNILIAVFDACRPDKISSYGFERPTTPELDRLAADPDSVLFERYYVQGSWTKPSTASLFTGLYLNQHHVSGGSDGEAGQRWYSALSDELDTMAEAFQQAGYYTFGVTSNPHLDPRFGFDQGFDTYRLLDPLDVRLMKEALRLVEKSERPFLGYVHFVACHYPYAAFRDREYMATYEFPYDERARRDARVNFRGPAIRDAINAGKIELEPDDVRFLNLVYEARMRSVDRRLVGPMMEGLRELGVWDDTLFIFTADHGEELYDHGGYGHGHALWEEVIHVPFIVKFPRGARPDVLGARWPGLARAVDVFPSLTAVAGIERPTSSYGRDIFRGEEVPFSLTDGLNPRDDWALVRGWDKVISWPGKMVLLPVSQRPIRVRPSALFDLEQDPLESRNLIVEQPDKVIAAQRLVGHLRRSLSKPRTNFTDAETEPLSDEAIETLRSLGYVD